MDATNWYGHSMIQTLPYDEIELWHGDPDLYMNKLEYILNTADVSDNGFFLEVYLRYPDNKKRKQRFFYFVLKRKWFIKINIMISGKKENLRII